MELSEKSNNAQLAREVEIALPVELSREEQVRLVREYCSSQFVSKGMIADFNLHDTGGGNPHAHISDNAPLLRKGFPGYPPFHAFCNYFLHATLRKCLFQNVHHILVCQHFRP